MDASRTIRRTMSTPKSSLSDEEEDSDTDQDVRPPPVCMWLLYTLVDARYAI